MEIPRGGGSHIQSRKFFKVSKTLNWNFQRDERGKFKLQLQLCVQSVLEINLPGHCLSLLF